MCNQNEYGNDCEACHPFCGHCTGPDLDQCIYCTRDTTLHVIHSDVYGNCTCEPGYYYEDTTKTCELCDPKCSTCFGSTNYACYTCALGENLYPPHTCVSTCDSTDVQELVDNGHYSYTEADGSKICVTCHPYCTKCTAGGNDACLECTPGFYL